MTDEKEKSDFGKGTTYCIGLFLAHESMHDGEPSWTPELWFNGASDHFYDLQTTGNKEIDERLKNLQAKCLHWGYGFAPPVATKEDKAWALQESKEILLMIDRHFLAVDTEKGQWE